MKSVIVYGPAGCGKTTNREAIRDALGLKHIIDDTYGKVAVKPDTLYLAQDVTLVTFIGPLDLFPDYMTYSQAMNLVQANLKPPKKGRSP